MPKIRIKKDTAKTIDNLVGLYAIEYDENDESYTRPKDLKELTHDLLNLKDCLQTKINTVEQIIARGVEDGSIAVKDQTSLKNKDIKVKGSLYFIGGYHRLADSYITTESIYIFGQNAVIGSNYFAPARKGKSARLIV